MIVRYILFILALANLIAISIMIYLRKKKWATSLSILEVVLVYLSQIIKA